jgi:hypothetical protein
LLLLSTNNRIYDLELKKFAAFMYLRSGRRAYSTLCANLPFPKVLTIVKCIYHVGSRIKEGAVRIKELEVFLQSRKIHLAFKEDGTRVTPRVQYDGTNGEIIGLSLPL